MELITSRAVIGQYYARLDLGGLGWVNGISNLFGSDQESESYGFLGMTPAMREWIGGRSAKGLKESGFTIRNKHYESTLEIALRDIRRDKSGQIMARVNDFADRAQSHWGSLLSSLILGGAATVCYDGEYYFDTDHAEGTSGTQSNSITVDVSDLPAVSHGTYLAPSREEAQGAVMKAIAAIQGFKDDQGEPMNETAMEFLVIAPSSLYMALLDGVGSTVITSGANNILTGIPGLKIQVQLNPRLNAWTDKFVVFRTDASMKALIRQQETEGELKAKAEGSEFEFDEDAWQFGIDSWRNVGYGYWQNACLVTLVA
jgi:phage major head subunit gpT-like protein